MTFIASIIVINQINAQCNITGWTTVCAGDQKQYTVTGLGGYIPQFSVFPSSASTGNSRVGNVYTVNWNSTFFSGCTGVAFVICTNGLPGPGNTCSLAVTVHRQPSSGGITGPSVVTPVTGWTNELPEVEYTVPASCFSSITWTTPQGWNIISGQGTTKIKVKPAINAACSGTITVDVHGQIGGCDNIETKSVSRDPVAFATITNHVVPQPVGSWPPLEICPDDDIIMDFSSSNFCNSSHTDVYIELVECDASWNVIGTRQGMWFNTSQYQALGGPLHFDVRKFATNALVPAFAINANSFYALKIAVGSPQWNERTMYIEVKPSGGAAPTFVDAQLVYPIQPAPAPRTVKAIWQGNPLTNYEIIFQTADNCDFLLSSVNTNTEFISCFTPSMYSPGFVSLDISGLPALHKFRYKVRECNCGTWSNWMTTTPCMSLPKPGHPNSIAERAEDVMQLEVAPNPFDKIINIKFYLESESKVALKILDVTGKLVISLDEKSYNSGDNNIKIETASMSPGLYNVMIITESGIFNNKMVKL